jgi:hypothetical protein
MLRRGEVGASPQTKFHDPKKYKEIKRRIP